LRDLQGGFRGGEAEPEGEKPKRTEGGEKIEERCWHAQPMQKEKVSIRAQRRDFGLRKKDQRTIGRRVIRQSLRSKRGNVGKSEGRAGGMKKE